MNIYEIRSAIFQFPKKFPLSNHNVHFMKLSKIVTIIRTYHKILKKTNFKEIPIGLNC